jgi:ketosteroid isomerase-like protein
MRDDVVRVVESYLRALEAGDLSDVPLHPDVEWEGPLGHTIKGATVLRATLSVLSSIVTRVTIVRHIVEHEWCATMFKLRTTQGEVSIFDSFEVVDGQIRSIRVFLDRYPNRSIAGIL